MSIDISHPVHGRAHPLLEVSGLSKSFGGVQAVADVSLSIEPGSVHGLIGPNGAGKTTCFNMIAGALSPDDGRVALDGTDITRRAAWQVSRAGISRTFQNIRLFSELTVRENIYTAAFVRSPIGYIGSLLGLPSARRAEQDMHQSVDDLIHTVELEPYRDALAADVPIGIQRRVEIARALALRPRLLLLDEPTAGMNSEETANIGEVVRSLSGDVTILLVEHDMNFVTQTCSTVTTLDRGHIISQGTAAEVMTDPAVIEAYLGKSYG